MKTYWWSDSSGLVELQLTQADMDALPPRGAAGAAIAWLQTQSHIATQFECISDATLVKVLDAYGAWDATELQDREANERRVLWLAIQDKYPEWVNA